MVDFSKTKIKGLRWLHILTIVSVSTFSLTFASRAAAEVGIPDSRPAYSPIVCEASAVELDWSAGTIVSGSTSMGQPINTTVNNSLEYALDDASIEWVRSDGVVATATVNTALTTAPLGSGYFRPGTSGSEGMWLHYGSGPVNDDSSSTYTPATIATNEKYVWDIDFSEPVIGLAVSSADIDGNDDSFNDRATISGSLAGSPVSSGVGYPGSQTAYTQIGSAHEFLQTANMNLATSDPQGFALVDFNSTWIDKVTIEYMTFDLASIESSNAPAISLSMDEGCAPLGVSKSADLVVNPDGTITVDYTVTATNFSGADMYDVQLTDALPFDQSDVLGVTLTEGVGLTAADLNTAFDGYSDTNILAGALDSNVIMNTSGSVSFTISVNLAASTPTITYDNQVEVSAAISEDSETRISDLSDDGVDPDPTNDNSVGSTDDPTPVTIPPSASINLTKLISGTALSSPVVPGDVVTYSLVIVNDGNVDLTDVVLDDPVLGGDITSSCVFPTSSVVGLAVGESATCSVDYPLTAGDIAAGEVINTATVSGVDPSDGVVDDVSDDATGYPDDGSNESSDDDVDDDPTNDPTPFVLDGIISGNVWFDVDNSQSIDSGESFAGSVQVDLLDFNGNVIATVMTDSNGYYSFANLLPGEYQVRIVLPAGYSQTFDNDGAGDHTISNIILGDGESLGNQNFGYIPPPELAATGVSSGNLAASGIIALLVGFVIVMFTKRPTRKFV